MANTISSSIMPNIIGPAKESLRESAALVSIVDKDFAGAAGSMGQVANIGVRADLAAAAITPDERCPGWYRQDHRSA